MKKTITTIFAVAALIVATNYTSNAQLRISVGPELGMPMGDFADGFGIGFGGTLGAEYGVSENLGIGLRAGYLTFSGKDALDGFKNNMIPIQAFAKYYFMESQDGFYGMVNLGFHNSKINVEGAEGSTDLSYAPEVGYHLANIDLGLRYQMVATEESTTSYLGVRIAYVFGEK